MAKDLQDMLATEPVRWSEDMPPDAPGRGSWLAREQVKVAEQMVEQMAEQMNASLSGAPTWLERVERVKHFRPDLRDAFGESVIVAAAKPMPAGACRYCHAVLFARVHKVKLPQFDAATQSLLGTPCGECLTAVRDQLVAAVNPGQRQRQRQGVLHPVVTGCATCDVGRYALKSLLASGAPPNPGLALLADRALADHPIRTAPTGYVSAVVHDGRGPLDGCACRECKGARVFRYERNALRARESKR
jgi:hypothetical protein